MARKKVEPIVSLGNDDKLTVQKSLPLFALWRSDLTLAEFKILDTYLARINSHEPNKRTVVFGKGELESLLGVKRIRTEELDERLKNLGTPIRIDDNSSKYTKFKRISLFEKSEVEADANGLWTVELTASSSAMKYFFNIDNLGYLRYKLRCITSITSRYTYIMFLYLESNRYRATWEVPLQELKEILNCENIELYNEFRRFNDKILKPVHKEMEQKTECIYRYESVKKGKYVVAVRFTVATLPKSSQEEIDENQYTFDCDAMPRGDLFDLAFEPLALSQEQLNEIKGYLAFIPSDKLPLNGIIDGNELLRQYHYADNRVKEVIRRDKQSPIKNKYNYLLTIIKKDCGLI